MADIKLVLTDVDGTIVRHGEHMSTAAVAQAVQRVQTAGVQLTAATGRPYEKASQLFSALNFRGLCIFDGGASIRDVATGELVWSNWLEPWRLKEIARILLPYSTLIDFFPVCHEIPAEEASITSIIEPAPYVYAFVRSEYRQKVLGQLQDVIDLSLYIGHAHPDASDLFDIHISDVRADKFHAVAALRSIVHSAQHETLAIGDSTNDLPLFQSAGLKIAMGNAVEALKLQADHIVGGLDRDGFAEAMHRFVLAQEGRNPAAELDDHKRQQ